MYLQTEDAQLKPLGLWLGFRLHLQRGHLRLLAQVSWLRRRLTPLSRATMMMRIGNLWIPCICDIFVSHFWWDLSNTFLLSGCLGNMFQHHTLYALLYQRGGSRDQIQLLPALSHLLLHLFIISCTACTLYQLNTNTPHRHMPCSHARLAWLCKYTSITCTQTHFDSRGKKIILASRNLEQNLRIVTALHNILWLISWCKGSTRL